jgi:hypothetical protein
MFSSPATSNRMRMSSPLFARPTFLSMRSLTGCRRGRGSVLAALLSGRPVIVNAPQNQQEFDHHPAFRGAIATGALRLVAAEDICAYADAVERAHGTCQNVAIDFDQCWGDAASAFEHLLHDEPVFTSMPVTVPAE